MTDESISSTLTIRASVQTVFAVLADPSAHQAIDGTGWVREARDGRTLTGLGQIFRMAMYHDDHPDKHYEMANRVSTFEPPSAIAWCPGTGPAGAMTSASAADADLVFGGWVWRYDLEAVGPDQTRVTLTYDWSHVPPASRDIEFPPFEPAHLDNSLRHLAEMTESKGP